MLDENVSWKERIKTVEIKLSENIGFVMQSQTIT